ncbi:MAG: glycerophosphodiester phosphodiesterase family protein [Actinomycetota bacterium]
MADTIHPFFDHDGPIPLAHQGGAAEEVENSAAAFANAAALGYHHLDVDLQATTDGVLVAHHDDSLQRLTGVDAAVGDLSWDDVAELRLPNGEPLARFDELLDEHPEARWNIELKDDGSIGPTVDLVRQRRLDQRVCLNTFDDRRMRRIRRAAVGIEPAYSTPIAATLWLKAASWIPFLPYRTSADVTQAPVEDRGIKVLDERFVRRAEKAGLVVVVWTIDEADEMARLLDLGVDGILTDAPQTLRTVLDGR